MTPWTRCSSWVFMKNSLLPSLSSSTEISARFVCCFRPVWLSPPRVVGDRVRSRRASFLPCTGTLTRSIELCVRLGQADGISSDSLEASVRRGYQRASLACSASRQAGRAGLDPLHPRQCEEVGVIPPYEVFLVLPGHVLYTPAGHPTTSVAFLHPNSTMPDN